MPPFLPLASILPGAGVSIGVNLATEVLPNTLESASVGIDLIQNITVPLTAAQIAGMHTTPVTLVPAPAAGKTIILYRALFRFVAGGTQFAGMGTTVIQYHSGAVAATNTIAASVITGSSNADVIRQGIDVTAVDATPLEITSSAAYTGGGTGTATVELWYSVY